ncbi:MAG: sigma-70 family RNA polymerase sigma factor [Acidobacteriota bacterium]
MEIAVPRPALAQDAAEESGLLARLRDGDEAACRELIRRYEGQVAATVTGILGRGPDIDDIGQETFIQFFRSLPRFRGESTIRTYLTRIAINLSLNELRRRRKFDRFQRVEPDQGEADVLPAPDRSGAEEARFDVRQGLEKLEPRYRAVIVLRLVEGFSTRETAKILGLPQGTVLSRLARGQGRLKALLEGKGPA